MPADTAPLPLKEQFSRGLDAPICLTWELTYVCNLACVHCLSSSGRRDPNELTPAEARGIVDDMVDMKVFYVNIGGGEPMLRPDFFDLVSYAVERKVGVKFSTNGTRLTPERSRQLAALDYLDVQISIDGATAATNDVVRGQGSFAAARTAMDNLAAADFGPFKISVVITRQNMDELDALAAIADSYGAQLRLTRLRPSGRAVDTWDALHPTAAQQRTLYRWLLERPGVLTGDSFFHLSALGEPLDGLNLCGAGRVVCLVDPVGDVYACPFVIDRQFLAGNVRDPGGFPAVWRDSDLFTSLRAPRARAPAPRAAPSTRARVAAWRPSSSPACRSTGPTPNVCTGTARPPWRRWTRGRTPCSATPRWHGTGRRSRCPRPSASARRPAPEPVELAGATWPQVEATEARTVLAVPLGSLEQHGPHLPLDTDTRIAVAVATGLAARCAGVTVAPAVAYGASGEHADFPGTLLLGHAVLVDLLVELVRSARRSFAGVVLVNAHGGNDDALAVVQGRCTAEGDDVLVWRAVVRGGDAHAGRTETSLLLAIEPTAVRLSLAEPGRTEPLVTLLPRLRAEGVRPVSSNGVLGDPTGASAEEGRALLDVLVSDLAASVSSHWPPS